MKQSQAPPGVSKTQASTATLDVQPRSSTTTVDVQPPRAEAKRGSADSMDLLVTPRPATLSILASFKAGESVT